MWEENRGWGRVIAIDDEQGRARLEQALRDWEPAIELAVPPRDALLYEPDGTLYAVCLAETQTVRFQHRTVVARRGDLLVIPRALAVDVTPEVRLLGVRACDFHPDHFRERFLQVWGFEHRAAQGAAGPGPGPGGFEPLIPPTEVRHRLACSLGRIRGAEPTPLPTGDDPCIVVGLEGTVRVARPAGVRVPTTGPHEVELREGTLIGLPPIGTYLLAGDGAVAIIPWTTTLGHERRRREADSPSRPPSPEFDPSGPSTSDRSGPTA